MNEREREIRRRRRRRKKAKKAKIRELIAKAGKIPKKKQVDILHEATDEKKIIQRKPAAKVIKTSQEGHVEAVKEG